MTPFSHICVELGYRVVIPAGLKQPDGHPSSEPFWRSNAGRVGITLKRSATAVGDVCANGLEGKGALRAAADEAGIQNIAARPACPELAQLCRQAKCLVTAGADAVH
ncbi:MAG: hypothetical protein CMN14_13435 [Roseobacter sp.]|nr:hypothetical protein [Roseobacter sp.]